MASLGKARDSLAEVANGAFVRTASACRDWVRKDGSTPYAPAAGRYTLYVSYACPWASRVLAARALKGLEHVIDVAVVAPIWDFTKPGVDEHRGWVFDPSVPGATSDPIFGSRTLRGVYDASAEAGGTAVPKFTVPALVDKVTRRVVNNESSELVRMLNTEFNDLATNPSLDLYPPHLRDEIDTVNAEIYDAVNNGVYKCGFAQAQAPYNEAFSALFSCLDKYERHLSTRRYLCGDQLTEADIRFFVTLVRFDAVYYVHFKCNGGLIRADYPALAAYTRDVYQTPGIAGSVNMEHIKAHYYGSHAKLNPYGIIPHGRREDTDFAAPHEREKLQ